MPKALLGFLPPALLMLATTGCSTTLFETFPQGQVTTCDSAWPGRWHPDGKADETLAINDGCTSTTFTKPGEAPEQKSVTLTLVSTAHGQYLHLRSEGDATECFDKAHCGKTLHRYVRQGNEIRIFEPDHVWVAAAIKKHKLPGFSEKESTPVRLLAPPQASSGGAADGTPKPDDAPIAPGPTYGNLVTGTPEQIAAMLDRNPKMFSTEPFLILRRDAEPAATTPTP
ncbi:hypothetical protein [Lysobacter fragariae]